MRLTVPSAKPVFSGSPVAGSLFRHTDGGWRDDATFRSFRSTQSAFRCFAVLL